MSHGTDSGIKISWSRNLELYLVRLNLVGPVDKIDSLEIITISLQSEKP